jgi:hypothetical protein
MAGRCQKVQRTVFGILLTLGAAVPARAQGGIGGMIKKKARDAIGPTQTPAAAGQKGSAATVAKGPFNGAAKPVITSDVLGRFVTAMRAELAERDRIKQERAADDLGVYYQMRDRHQRCDSVKASVPAREAQWQKDYQAAMSRGDADAMKKAIATMQAIASEKEKANNCDGGQKRFTDGDAFFAQVQSAQSRQDGVGAKAGGFGVDDFAYLRERVAAYLLGGTWGGDRQPVGYLPAELSALEARRAELVPLLQRDFNSAGMPKGTYEW